MVSLTSSQPSGRLNDHWAKQIQTDDWGITNCKMMILLEIISRENEKIYSLVCVRSAMVLCSMHECLSDCAIQQIGCYQIHRRDHGEFVQATRTA